MASWNMPLSQSLQAWDQRSVEQAGTRARPQCPGCLEKLQRPKTLHLDFVLATGPQGLTTLPIHFSSILVTRHLCTLPSPLCPYHSFFSLSPVSLPGGPTPCAELHHSTAHHVISFVCAGEAKLGHTSAPPPSTTSSPMAFSD